ncbi:unnamed protein product, partial [Symbiodinium sp. KB8]
SPVRRAEVRPANRYWQRSWSRSDARVCLVKRKRGLGGDSRALRRRQMRRAVTNPERPIPLNEGVVLPVCSQVRLSIYDFPRKSLTTPEARLAVKLVFDPVSIHISDSSIYLTGSSIVAMAVQQGTIQLLLEGHAFHNEHPILQVQKKHHSIGNGALFTLADAEGTIDANVAETAEPVGLGDAVQLLHWDAQRCQDATMLHVQSWKRVSGSEDLRRAPTPTRRPNFVGEVNQGQGQFADNPYSREYGHGQDSRQFGQEQFFVALSQDPDRSAAAYRPTEPPTAQRHSWQPASAPPESAQRSHQEDPGAWQMIDSPPRTDARQTEEPGLPPAQWTSHPAAPMQAQAYQHQQQTFPAVQPGWQQQQQQQHGVMQGFQQIDQQRSPQ